MLSLGSRRSREVAPLLDNTQEDTLGFPAYMHDEITVLKDEARNTKKALGILTAK